MQITLVKESSKRYRKATIFECAKKCKNLRKISAKLDIAEMRKSMLKILIEQVQVTMKKHAQSQHCRIREKMQKHSEMKQQAQRLKVVEKFERTCAPSALRKNVY